MTPEENEIYESWIRFNTLLSEGGYPTDPRKMKEVIASILTGCEPNRQKSGPDCHVIGEDGKRKPCERKSTTAKNIKGTYTGQSKKKVWSEQVKYTKKKVKDMERHYFDRFCQKTGRLLESWYMTGDDAYGLIIPQIEKDFHMVRKDPLADPRPKASICMRDIKQHGTKVL
tara:strand:+ start:517 stop:1029 length:513 start_codon:yes stop_codon:yes gene_type:complete